MKHSELTYEQQVDWYCMFVPSLISLIAGAYMLGTVYMFKKLRTPTMSLVMLQTVFEMLFCLSHNVAFYNPPPTGTPACRFQGWFLDAMLLCSLFFSASISAYMVSTIRRSKKYELNAYNLSLLTAVIVSVASGVAALPFITDQYINFGPVCWIAENEEGRPRIPGIIYRFPGHYCIIWACNLYIFFSYRSVLKYLSLLRREKRVARESRTSFQLTEENMQIKKTVKLLMYYPMIVFAVWAPLTALRLYQSASNNQDVPIWTVGTFHVILSMQGAMFAVVFSQYRTVKQEWAFFIYGKDYVASTVPLTGSSPHSHELPVNVELGESSMVLSSVAESTAIARPGSRRGGPARHETEDFGMSTVMESEFDHTGPGLPRMSEGGGEDDDDELKMRPTLEAVLEEEDDGTTDI